MKTIGKYQLFAEIHQGPITTLYKAYHPELDRIVIIKRLNPDRISDQDLCERFQQEGLIIAKINHPNVINIFDYGVHNEMPYLVMEFIEGVTLADVLKEHYNLPFSIALFIMQQTCLGLAALHQKNFIHRDIKPDNILISNEGNVKIGDFGFAENKLNSSNCMMGTPAYMSPEIVLSQKVDERSDIFSMGIVFYKMLSSENPFNAKTSSAIFKKIVSVNPRLLKKINPNIPEEISSLCHKMLAKDRLQRYASIKPIIKELEPFTKNINAESLINYLHNPAEYSETPIKTISPRSEVNKTIIALKFIYLPLIIISAIIIILYFSRPDSSEQKISSPINETNAGNSSQIFMGDSVIEIPDNNKIENSDLKNELTYSKTEKPGSYPLMPSFKKISDNSRIIKPAPIYITTDPRAWVIVNGDSIGISPLKLEITDLSNKFQLEFNSPGLPIIKKDIFINDITDNELHFSLWQEIGYLHISVNPWGEIWIDGDSIDVTPLLHPLIIMPGNHVLKIHHPQLKKVIEKINIIAGDTLRKSITLIK